MKEDSIYEELVKICGTKAVSQDPKSLLDYSIDMSLLEGKVPKFIVYPSHTKQIEHILRLANKLDFSVVPVSSISQSKHHGDTIPRKDNAIILNLSKMNKIISIDRKNRVIMIEPGVTFKKLIPQLEKKGLKLLNPLQPLSSKSVVTAALEREPIIIPRYHWDSSDPLLCTEVVFGTGELFRTGTAAGPGTKKQQQKSGLAYANPMGPTQFSPFRVIQGAQGSLGVVSWASLKVELLPSIQKVYHFQSENIQDLLDLQYQLLKFRFCDELLILNNLNLACTLKSKPEEIAKLSRDLSKWNLIFIISGRGPLANDKILYLEAEIEELNEKLSYKSSIIKEGKYEEEILNHLNNPCDIPWRSKLKGAYQDVFFLTSFEKIPQFFTLIESQSFENLGIYIQPINQGTSYHFEFDVYHKVGELVEKDETIKKILELNSQLMENGAFFSRPYGLWTRDVYRHQNSENINALKKVKKIFDPNNILNPGVLCFDV
ncbi:MAG: FAD-binding oxidoreductase [Candidatus Hermodarchaeota archaeon]